MDFQCFINCPCAAAAAAAKSLQLCPTLYNPIDGSPQGSALPGILQARTLEWVVQRIEENNRMGKTRDLFKKIRDMKGILVIGKKMHINCCITR